MAYIYRSNSSASGTTATISAWVKSVRTDHDAGVFQFKSGSNTISFYTNPVMKFRVYTSGGYSTGDLVNNNRKFRDFGGWWHVVATIDTTNATSGERLRLYINGVRQTDFTTETYPSQNQSYSQLVSGNFELGKYSATDRTTYLAHVHYCDGYAYNADSFGSTDATTGQWKINTAPNVQYGSNGVVVKFASAGALGTDSSGNNNTMSISGTALQTQDNPSNNFCILNPLDRATNNSTDNLNGLSNGNTTFDTTSANNLVIKARGSIGVTSGKYYWEGKYNSGTAWAMGFCLQKLFEDNTAQYWDSSTVMAVAANGGSGTLYFNGRVGDSFNTGVSLSGGDIFGFALDIDNKGFYVHRNGTYITANSAVGNPTSGSSRTGSILGELTTGGYQNYIPDNEFIYPFCADISSGAPADMDMNFGNGYFGTTAISSEGTNASNIGKFEYDVPTGYTALSTKGLNE